MLINVCNRSNKHSFGENFYTSQNLSVILFYSKIIITNPLITLLHVSFVIGLLENDMIVQGFIDLMCWLAMSKTIKNFETV